MSNYVKLFSSLLDSTVWYTPPAVKVVWITLLAMADRDGLVESSVPGLANRAGVSREECETALFTFLSPDPDSRTKEHEGRRLEVIDGGWKLLNYEKYRDKASIEEKREKDAARQQRKRERDASKKVTPVTKSRLSSDLISEESQKREETPPASTALPVRNHPDPEVQKVIEAVLADPRLSALAPADVRDTVARSMPVGNRKPTAWYLQSVQDAAAVTESGELSSVTLKRLWGFLKATKAPRKDSDTPKSENGPSMYREFPSEPESGTVALPRAEQAAKAREFLAGIGKGKVA